MGLHDPEPRIRIARLAGHAAATALRGARRYGMMLEMISTGPDTVLGNARIVLIGKRADLTRVHVARDVPVVRSVWREGRRVA